MFLLTLVMILAPGLIAIRILWSKKEIRREDYRNIVCDYGIYSFLIHMVVYGVLLFTYPERTVSFAAEVNAISHITSVAFVFWYFTIALIAALVLPAIIPKVVEIWLSLEDSRGKKKDQKIKK